MRQNASRVFVSRVQDVYILKRSRPRTYSKHLPLSLKIEISPPLHIISCSPRVVGLAPPQIFSALTLLSIVRYDFKLLHA